MFTPSLSVTTPIFNALNEQFEGPHFIHGSYGISKTTSIVLYCHFSYIINRYLYNLENEGQECFLKELGEDQKYIPKKMFYWSMGEILDNDSELKEMERISLQAP